MRSVLCLTLVGAVSACVAPEIPTAHTVAPPPQAPARVGFEDAPLPNHKLAPTSDSVIRVAR